MSEECLAAKITVLAKMRIRTDALPHQALRSSLEGDYEAELERFRTTVPLQSKEDIDRMIEVEVDRLLLK